MRGLAFMNLAKLIGVKIQHLGIITPETNLGRMEGYPTILVHLWILSMVVNQEISSILMSHMQYRNT